MPSSVSVPASAWERWKPTLREKYVINNETSPALVEYLHAQNFLVTERVLKGKIGEWGWTKKLTKRQYAALASILKSLGPVEFIRPMRGGTCFERMDTKKINKQVNRKKPSTARKEDQPMPLPDFETACEILREAGITWESSGQTDEAQKAARSGVRRPRSWQTRTKRLSQQQVQPDDNEESIDDSNFSDSGESSTSDEFMEDLPNPSDNAFESSRALNLENFGPPSHHEQVARNMQAVPTHTQPALPYKFVWLMLLHNDLNPHKPRDQIARGPTLIVSHNDHLLLTSNDSAFNCFEFANVISEIDDSCMTSQEKDIAKALRDHYQTYDQSGHLKATLKFADYWIGQLLAGRIKPEDYDHDHRVAARSNLQRMLQEQNMELLATCYYIASVTMSYDRLGLLLAFFEDCIDCIETSSSYLAKILQPWIRFMVTHHRTVCSDYLPRSHRLEPAFLEQMRKIFDARSALQTSIADLERNGALNSATGLILCMYRAWQIGETNTDAGLYEKLECLKRAEAMFGPSHLITIQCVSMCADAHKLRRNMLDARYDYDIVVLRLQSCSRMLRPLFYRSLFQRAKLSIEQGNLAEAQQDLEVIIEFHLGTFGAQSPLTWEAAEALFLTLERRGFTGEAQQRRADLLEMYEQQWKQHPFRQRA